MITLTYRGKQLLELGRHKGQDVKIVFCVPRTQLAGMAIINVDVVMVALLYVAKRLCEP